MILENLVFKTYGEARRYCEKYGIEVKGNTDVFMIAKGLARAFLEGEKVRSVDFPILRIIDDYLKNGAKIERQDDYVCLIRADGEIIARGEDLKTLLMEAMFVLC